MNMKCDNFRLINILLMVILANVFVGCLTDRYTERPIASFDYYPSVNMNTVDTIRFTNNSKNADNYCWDFGDGSSTTEVNPNHTYMSYGSYKVKLFATKDGVSDSISKVIDISDEISLDSFVVYCDIPMNIDVDFDGIWDIQLLTEYLGGTGSYQFSQITSNNDFQIICDSDFVKAFDSNHSPQEYTQMYYIPKIYVLGDTIHDSDKFLLNRVHFCDKTSLIYASARSDKWIKDEIRYVGFCKTEGDKTKIGWIKLKVLNYYELVLISYKIPSEAHDLYINH